MGEGSIELGADGQCWFRCPWPDWDFDPLTDKPPKEHEDSGQQPYPVEVREDGIYLAHQQEPEKAQTISDIMAQTTINWGIKSIFGMAGHLNLGLADALRKIVSISGDG